MSDLYIFRNSLRDLVRAKKLTAAALLVALPIGLTILWRATAPKGQYHPADAYNTLTAGLVFGFVLVILSVVFATGVIAQEIEQKTIVYLLTRPVPRWRILLAKFAAAVVMTTLVAWVAAAGTALAAYGVSGLGASHLGRDLAILPIGALAYGALFLLVASLFNRPLVYGLLFAFGWEQFVPNMPGRFKDLSIMAYLRVLAPHAATQSDDRDMTVLLAMLNPHTITNHTAWLVLLSTILVCAGLALLVFSTREYVPREDAE